MCTRLRLALGTASPPGHGIFGRGHLAEGLVVKCGSFARDGAGIDSRMASRPKPMWAPAWSTDQCPVKYSFAWLQVEYTQRVLTWEASGVSLAESPPMYVSHRECWCIIFLLRAMAVVQASTSTFIPFLEGSLSLPSRRGVAPGTRISSVVTLSDLFLLLCTLLWRRPVP